MGPRSQSAKARRKSRARAPAQAEVRASLDRRLAAVQTLVPAALQDDDREALHDLRVSLRRARSLAQLLGGVFERPTQRELVGQMRALAASTGPVRDLDVHLAAREAQLEALPERLRPAGERVFEALVELRREARARMTDTLGGADYLARVGELRARLADASAWPEGPLAAEPLKEVVALALRERHAKVCKRVGKLSVQTPEPDVHRLRVGCKKLRYAAEFIQPVLERPGAVAPLVRRLKRVQKRLGHFNDCSVQRDRLMGHDWGHDDSARVLAAGALAGLLEAELSASRPLLVKDSQRLCESSLMRRLAEWR